MSMNFLKHFKMEGEPSVLAAPVQEPSVEPAPVDDSNVVDTSNSIYGDLKVNFPEGTPDDIRESSFLKPFVDKESGDLNYANLMKSYVHAQKNVNASKVTLPGENATDSELDEFWSKLGYEPNEENYKVEAPEEAVLSEDQVNALKKFARENRMPVGQAQKLVDFMNNNMSESQKAADTALKTQIEEGLNGLQQEWGQAYETKLGSARKVLDEVMDDSIKEVFADPRIGSNPAVIKVLNKIGEKMFKEDSISGDSNKGNGMMSPEEASIEINKIYGDPNHPYNKPGHPGRADAVKHMNKLFEMKQGR